MHIGVEGCGVVAFKTKAPFKKTVFKGKGVVNSFNVHLPTHGNFNAYLLTGWTKVYTASPFGWLGVGSPKPKGFKKVFKAKAPLKKQFQF